LVFIRKNFEIAREERGQKMQVYNIIALFLEQGYIRYFDFMNLGQAIPPPGF